MNDDRPRSTLWAELRELTRHRWLGLVRQPEALFWTFGFPLLLAFILGLAFSSSEPARSVVGLVDADAAAPWLARLEADPLVEVVRYGDAEKAARALRVGRVDLVVTDATADPPRLRLDPTRNEAEVARLRVLVAQGALAPDALAVEPVEERGARYVDFLLPGLLGMNLMGTGMWAIGFTIADMRQRKLLKRLLVTPMRRASLLGSFLLSRLVFLAIELALLIGFAVWVLGVPQRGSPPLFAGIAILGAAAFSGLGLLAASRARTIEGVSGMLNLMMMPMWLGSGVFFSYERFPEVVQPLLRALPLTALIDALRACMLEGAGLAGVASQLGVLALWLVGSFVVALRVFRWA